MEDRKWWWPERRKGGTMRNHQWTCFLCAVAGCALGIIISAAFLAQAREDLDSENRVLRNDLRAAQEKARFFQVTPETRIILRNRLELRGHSYRLSVVDTLLTNDSTFSPSTGTVEFLVQPEITQ